MKHLKSINRKASRIERLAGEPSQGTAGGATSFTQENVVALQQQGGPPQQAPHIPLGCTLIFSPGWEADRNGGTAGLCTPVERDLFDCHAGCYWPAPGPGQLNHAPDWTSKCASAQKDWRSLDLVFP